MRRLEDHRVTPGERWIFSAGFNVGPELADTGRIDAELDDLRHLLGDGARVALISHQGSHRDGTARDDLGYVAAYLARQLARPVPFVAEVASPAAVRRARALAPGEIVLFGNTRRLAGEETGEPALARALADLGDRVAVGGFSKAHRAHASNVGILRHRPGFAARSITREIAALAPWAEPADGVTVAVLGGVKAEKTTVGLSAFVERHDVVIPGGAVLNTLLAAAGKPVGASVLGDERCRRVAASVLAGPHRARIHLPTRVLVADPDGRTRLMAVDDVTPRSTIVDFVIEPWAADSVAGAQRVLVAGPPGQRQYGNQHAARTVLRARAGTRSTLLLGGDTVADLPWDGPRSTGGGSALQYLAHGRSTVVEALAANAETEFVHAP
jgi:phosphoglycerate kinase